MYSFAKRVDGGTARRRWLAVGTALIWRLMPRLSFDEPFESQFRDWYARHTRARVRNAMWIAMGTLLMIALAGGPFSAMRDAIFGPQNAFIVDVLRFGFLVPNSVAMFLVVYTSLYRKWFAITAQLVTAAHALCYVVMDILMHPRGYSLSSWMPLVVLAPYSLFGMLHVPNIPKSASMARLVFWSTRECTCRCARAPRYSRGFATRRTLPRSACPAPRPRENTPRFGFLLWAEFGF